MMNRFYRLFTVLLAATLLLAACVTQPAGEEAANQTETAAESSEGKTADAPADGSSDAITDGAGRELTFDEAPERIVCTYTRCMEVLAALELAPIAVASWVEPIAADPAYFPASSEIVILDDDGDFPDLEQITALEPDLVMTWAEMAEALGDIVPAYIVANDQDTYTESHDEIRMFAQLLGREEIAERNIQRALDRLTAYQTLARQDVSVMYGFFSNDAFSYRDGQSGACNLFAEVATCDWPDPEESSSWSVQINDEGLLQLDPDVLLIDSYGYEGQTDDEILATLSERPLWDELSAVQSGRIFIGSRELANMDGMGTVGMTQMLDVYMPLLYPDLFIEPLTDEQVQEILAEQQTLER
ncbi:MAG: ABC transporter substrate-binding protein [Chloroflexales bacterium]|nr:ABC transporter substrate-binding protein [Chloroflexales bacterium]